jgi:hypothetical protein
VKIQNTGLELQQDECNGDVEDGGHDEDAAVANGD